MLMLVVVMMLTIMITIIMLRSAGSLGKIGLKESYMAKNSPSSNIKMLRKKKETAEPSIFFPSTLRLRVLMK